MDTLLDTLTADDEMVRLNYTGTPKPLHFKRQSLPCYRRGYGQFNCNDKRGSLLRPGHQPESRAYHHKNNTAERADEQGTTKPLAGQSTWRINQIPRATKRATNEPSLRSSTNDVRQGFPINSMNSKHTMLKTSVRDVQQSQGDSWRPGSRKIPQRNCVSVELTLDRSGSSPRAICDDKTARPLTNHAYCGTGGSPVSPPSRLGWGSERHA